MVENVAGGLVDVALRLDQPPEQFDDLIAAAESVGSRYQALWDVLHAEPVFSYDDRYQVESRIRQLHELGFAVDEVNLVSAAGSDQLRLKVAVAARRYHASQLHDLTGLDVGEGQARILLLDMRAFQAHLQQQLRADITDASAALRWVEEVLRPGMARVADLGEAIQAYCDLLEVRWLLSEQAGADVGDEAAITALRARTVPPSSAAGMAVAEAVTGQLPALTPDMLEAMSSDDL
jgi:hypothetical protein